MDTQTANTIAAKITNANLSCAWVSGSREVTLKITGARVWTARNGMARVYLDTEFSGSRYDEPTDVYWDGEDLNANYEDLTHRKTAAAQQALSDIEDAIYDL